MPAGAGVECLTGEECVWCLGFIVASLGASPNEGASTRSMTNSEYRPASDSSGEHFRGVELRSGGGFGMLRDRSEVSDAAAAII